MTICNAALTTRHSATDSCISRYSVSKWAAMPGRPGRKMFFASAEIPVSRINVLICGAERRSSQRTEGEACMGYGLEPA